MRHFWLSTVFGIFLSGGEFRFDSYIEFAYNLMIYPDPMAVCETAASFSKFRDGRR
jgi:hypothetical protein